MRSVDESLFSPLADASTCARALFPPGREKNTPGKSPKLKARPRPLAIRVLPVSSAPRTPARGRRIVP